MSSSTGILLNNQMDDFNTGAVNDFDIPPSYSNLIQPGKRPLSSMCPSVFTDPSGNLQNKYLKIKFMTTFMVFKAYD